MSKIVFGVYLQLVIVAAKALASRPRLVVVVVVMMEMMVVSEMVAALARYFVVNGDTFRIRVELMRRRIDLYVQITVKF